MNISPCIDIYIYIYIYVLNKKLKQKFMSSDTFLKATTKVDIFLMKNNQVELVVRTFGQWV